MVYWVNISNDLYGMLECEALVKRNHNIINTTYYIIAEA